MTDATHFNQLSPAEAERLAYLIEEAAEVQQIACKILRHGMQSYDPTNPEKGNNRAQLGRELRDLAGAVERMVRAGDLTFHPLEDANPLKGQSYMHHQERP
jgi:hypothetical protein